MPIDMMRQDYSTTLFQARQQCSTISQDLKMRCDSLLSQYELPDNLDWIEFGRPALHSTTAAQSAMPARQAPQRWSRALRSRTIWRSPGFNRCLAPAQSHCGFVSFGIRTPPTVPIKTAIPGHSSPTRSGHISEPCWRMPVFKSAGGGIPTELDATGTHTRGHRHQLCHALRGCRGTQAVRGQNYGHR